jgi:hypothetical protein
MQDHHQENGTVTSAEPKPWAERGSSRSAAGYTMQLIAVKLLETSRKTG